jgi:hypothetical protein
MYNHVYNKNERVLSKRWAGHKAGVNLRPLKKVNVGYMIQNED